jgi:hypothetical protein
MALRTAAVLALISLAAAAQTATAPPAGPDLAAGWRAFAEGDAPAAIDAARAALKTSPGHPEALLLWGRSSLSAGDLQTGTGALRMLAGKRGTLDDLRLQALAHSMAGRWSDARAALDQAEKAPGATAEGLYALSWLTEEASRRGALLRRVEREFPAEAKGVSEEAAYWESKGPRLLNRVASPLPAEGAEVPLRTLYDLEWAAAKTSSGEEIWLLVDTACPRTVLSRETAERMGLGVVPASRPLPGAFAGAPAPAYTTLDRLDLGPVTLENVVAIVVDDSPGLLRFREGRTVLKGILGMDLLRGCKVRFDRQKNVLRLFSASIPVDRLLDGDPASWTAYPAFDVHGQVFVPTALGSKTEVLGLLSTGCTHVLATEAALPGTGLQASSRNAFSLAPSSFFGMPDRAAGTSIASVERVRHGSLGWMEECLAAVGNVRTVPKDAKVGFGPAVGILTDLPLYPAPLGAEVPASTVVGKKLTDFYAIALDLPGGKMYLRRVLFAK